MHNKILNIVGCHFWYVCPPHCYICLLNYIDWLISKLFLVSTKLVQRSRKLYNCWDWGKSTMVCLSDLIKLQSICYD